MTWQPIDTAPKTTEPILVLVRDFFDGSGRHWTKGYWSNYLNRWCGEGGHEIFPTHWLPLPEYPST